MVVDWERTRVEVIWGGKWTWPAGRAIEPSWIRWVTDHTVWVVFQGRGRMWMRDRVAPLQRGTCLWLRPGWEFKVRQTATDPLGMYSVHFNLLDADRTPRPFDRPLPPERPGAAVDGEFAIALMDRVAAAVQLHTPPSAQKVRMATALLTGWLMEVDAATDAGTAAPGHARHAAARSRQRHAQLLSLAQRIDSDPASAGSVEDLAAELGYTPSHFCRAFRAATAHSPQDYIIHRRLRRAGHLLVMTNLSMSEIAEQTGYRDVYFFSRQFRQRMGVTPTAYRRQGLENVSRAATPPA